MRNLPSTASRPAFPAGRPDDGAPRRQTGRKRGFTLLEMLVVILIIVILIAIAFSTFASVRLQAWRAKSRDLARQIAHAWNQRLLVYREFPQAAIDLQDAQTDEPRDFAYSDPYHLAILNTNRTVGNLFIELKNLERDSRGLRDKWGDLYKVRLDTDYNGLVQHPFSNIQVRASVIVWSDRFGNPSGPQYTVKTEDDIVAW